MAVAIYNASHVPVNRHCSSITVIIITGQKDDQWLIYRAQFETDFTKCFAVQDQIKRSQENNEASVKYQQYFNLKLMCLKMFMSSPDRGDMVMPLG